MTFQRKPRPGLDKMELTADRQKQIDIIDAAYEQAAWFHITYFREADEWHPENEETERWVLPLTKVVPTREGKLVFRAWCMHAQAEKEVQAAQDRLHPHQRALAPLMRATRMFRLDRIIAYREDLHRITNGNPWYEEIIAGFPGVRSKLGLKAQYVSWEDEETGEVKKERVMVAA